MLNFLRKQRILILLSAIVMMAHALLTQSMISHIVDQDKNTASIERMQAQLISEMKLAKPPVVSAATLPKAEPPAPTEIQATPLPDDSAAPAGAASAASSAQVLPKITPSPAPPKQPITTDQAEPVQNAQSEASVASQPSLAIGSENNASQPELAPVEASNTDVASASKLDFPEFIWPKATRITYKLHGYFRGPVHGTALVEWIRKDLNYQVHVDAVVGPSFAPLASQRWTSEGIITSTGLSPLKFESVNKLLVASSKPKLIIFEDDTIIMPNGDRLEKMKGVLDPASHYIQMAYQFILNSSALKVGGSIEMPIASTKKQELMIYDVEAQEVLDTPIGPIDTFKLVPRLPAKNSKGEELFAQLWLAPMLQFLPIRLLIKIGNENHLEMNIDQTPKQQINDEDQGMIAPASAPLE